MLGVFACSTFGEEATPAPDAGPETGDSTASSDAALGLISRPCGHTFCDDFDDSRDVGTRWTTPLVGAPGFFELVQGNVASAPNALLARFAGQKTGFAGAALRKELEKNAAARVTCRAKTFIEKLGTGHPTIMQIGANLAAGSPVTSTEVHVAIKSDLTTLSLFQAPAEGIYPTAQALARGAWLDLQLSVDFVTGDVRVTMNDTQLFMSRLAAQALPNNGAFFKLGTFDIGESDESRVLFDDVWCDIR